MTPRKVVEEWVQIFNEGDARALSLLYSENAVHHQVITKPATGRLAIQRLFELEFAMADLFCIIENIFEDGEWAVLEWKDPLGLRGCSIFRIGNGQIQFQRGYWDRQSFLELHKMPFPES